MRCQLSHHKKVPRLRIFIDYELNNIDVGAIRNSEMMNSQQFENANSNIFNLKHSTFQMNKNEKPEEQQEEEDFDRSFESQESDEVEEEESSESPSPSSDENVSGV
jgi:hypothetical protein